MGFHKWGYPKSWLVYVRENLHRSKWMMTGGSPMTQEAAISDASNHLPTRQDITWYSGWWARATPLKNMSQLGGLFPIYGKIKNVPNHQPVNYDWLPSCGWIGNHQLKTVVNIPLFGIYGVSTILKVVQDFASIQRNSDVLEHGYHLLRWFRCQDSDVP